MGLQEEDYHISRKEGGGTVYIKTMSKEEGLFNKSKCEMKISAHTSERSTFAEVTVVPQNAHPPRILLRVGIVKLKVFMSLFFCDLLAIN